MTPMRIIILLVAAAAAVLAAIMVRNLAAQSGQNGAPTETIIEVEVSEVEVLVATRDLSLGDVLAPEDMAWVLWPEGVLNVDYFTLDMAPDAIEELAGSVIRTNVYDQEPLMPQKIVVKGETGFMAALLEPGMRAIAIEISTETASGGFIVPNDRVDVILTYDAPVAGGGFSEEKTLSITIIENARVLAIDQIFRQDDTDGTAIGSTATLELPPRDAELLSLGEDLGTLALALRSVSDALEAGGVVTSLAEEFASGNQGGGGDVAIYRNGQPAGGR